VLHKVSPRKWAWGQWSRHCDKSRGVASPQSSRT
jgi:hypothetical protein